MGTLVQQHTDLQPRYQSASSCVSGRMFIWAMMVGVLSVHHAHKNGFFVLVPFCLFHWGNPISLCSSPAIKHSWQPRSHSAVMGSADSLAWIRNALARYCYLNGMLLQPLERYFLSDKVAENVKVLLLSPKYKNQKTLWATSVCLNRSVIFFSTSAFTQ